MGKVKGYHSNAKWSKIKNSSDFHNIKDTDEENLDYAETICELLMTRYGAGGSESPCEIRGVCLKTWVTDEKGKVIE